MKFRANKLPKFDVCPNCGKTSRHNWLVVMTLDARHHSAISDIRCSCGQNRFCFEGEPEPAFNLAFRVSLVLEILSEQKLAFGAERAGTVIPHASANMAHH